jgi:hypothetical protein
MVGENTYKIRIIKDKVVKNNNKTPLVSVSSLLKKRG